MSVAVWTVVLMTTSVVGQVRFRMTSSYAAGAKKSMSSWLTRSASS